MSKFVGGYNISIEGKPSSVITGHEKPEVLHLPLSSRSFDFDAMRVENGESVKRGQILAGDPVNFFVPLLAPMDGTVNLDAVERHISLENLSGSVDGSPDDEFEILDEENKRQLLLRLGVWSFMAKLDDGKVPDPETAPDALIVSPERFEPFFPSPDVFMSEHLDRFAEGLEQLHKVLDDTEVHLVLPENMSEIGNTLQRALNQSEAWFKRFEVPDLYPSENPALAAQMLGLNPDTTWTIDAQAVLAAEQALKHGRPYVTRIISVGGPEAANPSHFRVPIGYPLAALIGNSDPSVELRLIDGGVLTGRALETTQIGLDAQCVALTILRENTEREVLAFAQAGFGKQSFSRSFASALQPLFNEKFTTALRGEARPCVFCGYCEDACPAGLIPHVIYRYLDNDRIEDALRVGLSQCVECGLCSYVCLSKIEHLKLFREEKKKYAEEGSEE